MAIIKRNSVKSKLFTEETKRSTILKPPVVFFPLNSLDLSISFVLLFFHFLSFLFKILLVFRHAMIINFKTSIRNYYSPVPVNEFIAHILMATLSYRFIGFTKQPNLLSSEHILLY